MQLNEITYKVRGSIFKVYSELGPGLLESIYEAALMYQFLLPIHHKQLLSYLKLTNKKVGLLVNFNTDDILEDIVRIIN